jgi:hypothetical protein
LLRIREHGRHLLFHAASRPGSYGPPGGVFKYFEPAVRILDDLQFEAEATASYGVETRMDLRGFLPSRQVRRFLTWFDSGAYRETPDECLRRELIEELAEIGFPDLAQTVPRLSFVPVRSIVESLAPVPGKTFFQLRKFEVYDVLATDARVNHLIRELIRIGTDPAIHTAVYATAAEIHHGRAGPALIAPQTAFLIGSARLGPDLAPMR